MLDETSLLTGSAQRSYDRYPPPYRLLGDVAVFLLPATPELCDRWAGISVARVFGHGLLMVMVARYQRAFYGPRRRELQLEPSQPYGYHELACALLAGRDLPARLVFPQLWVNAPDATPLELGWRYGFPKAAAQVMSQMVDGRFSAQVSNGNGTVLECACTQGLSLPGWLALFLPGIEAVFPATGLRAGLSFLNARRISLLQVMRWDSPSLRANGAEGAPSRGLWLEGVTLHVGLPQQLHPSVLQR